MYLAMVEHGRFMIVYLLELAGLQRLGYVMVCGGWLE